MNEPPRSKPSTPTGANATHAPPAALTILPPREYPGKEPLFRVVYIIDVNGACPDDAARRTYRIMSDPASLPPVLEVIDHAGRTTTVDLSEAGLSGDATRDDSLMPVHPGIQQIHDLLYLDMQDGQHVYDAEKEWDSDTMSMIAEVVGEYIPGPRQVPGAVAGTDPPSRATGSPCIRRWKCPDCGRIIDHSYGDLVNIGIPICGDCDVDMELIRHLIATVTASSAFPVNHH